VSAERNLRLGSGARRTTRNASTVPPLSLFDNPEAPKRLWPGSSGRTAALDWHDEQPKETGQSQIWGQRGPRSSLPSWGTVLTESGRGRRHAGSKDNRCAKFGIQGNKKEPASRGYGVVNLDEATETTSVWGTGSGNEKLSGDKSKRRGWTWRTPQLR